MSSLLRLRISISRRNLPPFVEIERITFSSLTGEQIEVILPALILLVSSISSMRDRRYLLDVSTFSRLSFTVSGIPFSSSDNWVRPNIAVSGVLISWDICERNDSFSRLDCTAARRALPISSICSWSSICFVVSTNVSTRPFSSRFLVRLPSSGSSITFNSW